MYLEFTFWTDGTLRGISAFGRRSSGEFLALQIYPRPPWQVSTWCGHHLAFSNQTKTNTMGGLLVIPERSPCMEAPRASALPRTGEPQDET